MEIEWYLRSVRNGRLRRQLPNGGWSPIGSIEAAPTLDGLEALALSDSDEASLKASLILRRTQNRDGSRPSIPRVAIPRPDAHSTRLEDIQTGFALSMKNLSGNSILGIRATAPTHFVIADAVCSRSVGSTPRDAFHLHEGTEFNGNLTADRIHHTAKLQLGVLYLARLSDPITRLVDLRMEKNND